LWRRLAVRLQLRETAEERGAPTPEETMARALAVAESWQDFERHAGITLAMHASEVGAGKLFRRFAGWMDAIDKLIEEGVPQQYDRLLRSVEAAAEQCKGIPSQKLVRQFFEDGMSANQLGQADPFRSVLRKLRFDWLPPGGRGPNGAPKKSGR